MIDCTTFEVTKVRPLPGEVLIEIILPQSTPAGIRLPETSQPPDFLEGIVRKVSPAESAPEFVLGDRVILNTRTGRRLNEPPRIFKLVKVEEVLAKFV